MVGRTAELGVLDGILGDLAGGAPGSLLVSGEPGIGKTCLLSQLSERAGARGCLVLSGSASELESDLPFWIFVDALESHVAGFDRRQLAGLGDDVAAGLAQVIPALSDLAGGAQPVLEDQRYRAHRAVSALLARLATTQPVALILDDVHWADPASVELLAALLRDPPKGAVLLALGTRPRQAPERLATALERAHRRGALARLDLAGLERGDAGLLLGGGVDRVRADALFVESGGNPFYLEQLARHAGPVAGDGIEIAITGIEVPRAVIASLGEELAALSAPTRRVLEGAAVAGDPFEPELAAAAAALDEPDAMAALDELLARELLRPTGVPRRFRFRHPLVRRAVYESAPGGWRLGAHERSAAALAARGAPAATRAHHVEYAARHGDVASMAVLREAADSLLFRAPASAARWYAAALRVLPQDAPAAQRAELLSAAAGALAASGRIADSRESLLAAFELVPEETVAWWVGLAVACSGIEHLLGLHEQARHRLAAALERLPGGATPEAVALMVELAIDGLFSGEYEAMRDWAARARAVAVALGDRPLLAAATATVALADTFAGAPGAEAAYGEAAALLEAMSDDELARRPDATGNLAAAALHLDRYEEAALLVERALAIKEATGHVSPTIGTTLGMTRIMQGRLAEAAELLDGAIEQVRVGGVLQGLAFHLVHRSLAALAAGEIGAALAAAEEAFGYMQTLDERFISAWAGLSLAAALAAAGDPGRAEEILLAGGGGEQLDALPACWRVMALELLTRCRLSLGRTDDARRAAELATAVEAALGLAMTAAWAQRAQSAVSLASGRPGDAAERARESAAAAERAGAPLEAALSRDLAGRALAASGQDEAAAAEHELAAAAFAACGAPRRRAASELELRKLGRHIHRRTQAGAGGGGVATLTAREREIADLVVDRRTNPEIAAELFLSRKTVESHLRNIFHKLGAGSRVEVARIVERAGPP
ncbi:MAG TPA: AAA family ATPase [Solirubrobacteraceae bacterium]|nr:AAA family ATPase [Solirubrobacteraceae bacterium]